MFVRIGKTVLATNQIRLVTWDEANTMVLVVLVDGSTFTEMNVSINMWQDFYKKLEHATASVKGADEKK